MSDYVAKPMSMTMFENERRTSENHPMLNGKIRLGVEELMQLPQVEIEVDGVAKMVIDLDFSLWSKKVASTGKKFWSGNCKKAWVRTSDVENSNELPPHGADEPQEQSETAPEVDNDLPF
jgi:hypothetical protein